MNFTAIKKSSPTWLKFSNDYDMIQLQNQQFTNKTLHEHEYSTKLLVFSKGVLKNFAIFTGKHLCRVKCEPKSLIYPYSLHLHYKKDSCTQLFFSGFCRIFKNTFLLEHSWASASDFIFDTFKSNKYMKKSFLLTVFYKKSKIKQKSRLALKLGNLRIALQWSHSFVKLLLFYTLKIFLGTNWTKIWFKKRFALCKQMFGMRNMSPLLLRTNLSQIFIIYDI